MNTRSATPLSSGICRPRGSHASVLCVGPILMDRLLFEAEGREDLYPGGNAVITGAVLARRGIHTKVLGQVGGDAHGEKIQKLLKYHHVDTSCLRPIPDTRTKIVTIAV